MTIKMIASDMDGTFLDHRGTYDRQRFERVLKELEARDIEFVVASGNQMGRLNRMFDGLTDRLAFVADNGAHIVEEGETVIKQVMSHELARACLAHFRGKWKDYNVMVTGSGGTYVVEGMEFKVREGFPITVDELRSFFTNIVYLPDLTELPEDDAIMKVTLMVPIEEIDTITSDFNQRFKELTAVSSGYGGIDIIQTGINKAWGLRQLMAKRGISADQLMAFGDGGNDIEMLQLAEHSYAVDNASDIVKVAAKKLAPSHEEAGVLHVIEAYLAGQLKN